MKYLFLAWLFLASTQAPASSIHDERLVAAASRNIDDAQICWQDEDMHHFLVNMQSAILKLNSTESVDTVRYVIARLENDQIWYLIRAFRRESV